MIAAYNRTKVFGESPSEVRELKKVLIITYTFPPLGAGDTMRVSRFVKYLPSFGWKPVVLTVSNHDYQVRDDMILSEFSPEVKIYTARTLEPKQLVGKVKSLIRDRQGKAGGGVTAEIAATSGIIYHAGRMKVAFSDLFLIPSQEVLWNRSAFKAAVRIIDREGIDLVFTTSPPHSVQLIGARLQKRYGLPWVSDFRDGWVGNVLFKPKYGLRERAEQRMESDVVKRSSVVVSATPPITEGFINRNPEMAEKFITITNGYDGEYYKEGVIPHNNKFTLTYAGGLGGRRTSRYIYEALVLLKERAPEVYKELRVVHVGNFYDDKGPWIKNLKGCVEFVPQLPYREVPELLQKSDVLLMVTHESEGGRSIASGKIFEYIGAGRPILATVPDCVAKDLVEDNGLGITVGSEDVEAIMGAIMDLHGRWKRGLLSIKAPAGFREGFERKKLTGDLAEVFDSLTVDVSKESS